MNGRLTTVLILLVCGGPLSLSAESLDPSVSRVAQGIDEVLAELEQAQAETQELKRELSLLESQSIEHQIALTEQQRRLETYHQTVSVLEAQARDQGALARDLQRSLDREKAWNGWLWPVAGTAAAVAVIEGIVLVAGRR